MTTISPMLTMLRFLLLITVALFAGCDGALTPTGRLIGHWEGLPEIAAERTEREWPVKEQADKTVVTPVTDIEAFPDLRISLQFDRHGKASLSLDGDKELSGNWTLIAGEGKRQILEIAIEDSEGTVTERRKFEIEMLKKQENESDRFVLRESGADPRFGRLLFERSK